MRKIDQAVILCGGLGTRLKALTHDTPKPLLHVAGEPFLAHLVCRLADQGLRRFVFLASFLSDQIEQFARSLPSHVEAVTSVEPALAGTGGALYHALPLLDDSFYLLNGDSLFDIRIAALEELLNEHKECVGALALREIEDGTRFGVVRLEGDKLISFGAAGRSGPGLINGGVYALRRTIGDHLRTRCSLEQDIFPKLAELGLIAGRQETGYFIDIGVPEDFARAQRELTGDSNSMSRPLWIDMSSRS